MTPEEKEANKAAARAWVNEMRAELGEEPIPGLLPAKRGCPDSCVLARAITAGTRISCEVATATTGDGYLDVEEFGERPMPEHINTFACDFDNGLYPELDIELVGESGATP